jgi:translation elongation factor EF-G
MHPGSVQVRLTLYLRVVKMKNGVKNMSFINKVELSEYKFKYCLEDLEVEIDGYASPYYVTYYSVHQKFIDKFTKLWDKLGIEYDEEATVDREGDEIEWKLVGPKDALIKFYQTIMKPKPSAKEIEKGLENTLLKNTMGV